MQTLLMRSLIAATLTSAMSLASAAGPVMLSNAEMDSVSAGGQYSIVSGGGFAEVGTVLTSADTKAVLKGNGGGMTKANLRVTVSGTGLFAYGAGESGAGEAVSGVYGEAASASGTIDIRVRTMAKTKPDGDVMLKSKIKIKTNGSGGLNLSNKSTTVF